MGVRRVSPAEGLTLVEDEGYVHVDVRTEAEWAGGHARGAINVPYPLAGPAGVIPNDDFLRVMFALFPKDRPLLLSCKSGGRSLKAALLLEAHGYTRVVDQRAGMDGVRDPFGRVVEPGWARAGLPQELSTAEGSYSQVLRQVGGES
jgi:rhodanese-related sulfurtransferase